MLHLSSQAQSFPAAPETSSVVSCLPDTTGYARITVGPTGKDFQDLQEAIDAAAPGSVILIDPGTPNEGGFVLPVKADTDQWIIIASARMDVLPESNHRIEPFAPTGDPLFPMQHLAMPVLLTTHLSGIPCVRVLPGAHHYWLMGLELTADISVTESFGLINFGESGTTQNTLEKLPHHLVLDRCYIHGHSEGTIMKYGVRLDCADGAVLDCHISDFHSIGFDAQAISCINGSGPFRIINNYLEASGENILIGGGTPGIEGLVPSNIEILRNHLYKPWSWRVGHPDYAGKHWTVKNHFELKTGTRVLFEGNTLENCWADLPVGQSGYSILLTVRTEGGNYPQANVSDVMIRNNIIRHTGAGITISGSDGVNSIRSERIMILNNLFDDINGPAYGDQQVFGPNDGTFLKIGNPADVIVDHNTILQSGPVTWAYGVTDSFVFTRNITQCLLSAGGYRGIYGPGQIEGNNTMAAYFPDVTDENRHFHQNVLMSGIADKYDHFADSSENYFPADAASVDFNDFEGGEVDYHGYELSPSSLYYLAGDDGFSPGVNFEILDAALEDQSECEMMETGNAPVASVFGQVDLFPNPAHGFLHVRLHAGEVSRYQCFDMSGRMRCQADTDSSSFFIDIKGMPGGLYLLRLFLVDGVVSRTFVVQ